MPTAPDNYPIFLLSLPKIDFVELSTSHHGHPELNGPQRGTNDPDEVGHLTTRILLDCQVLLHDGSRLHFIQHFPWAPFGAKGSKVLEEVTRKFYKVRGLQFVS